ncbi:unnamed protein product, partial [Prunus brigantina]
WSIVPAPARCRTHTGFGSDSKVEFGLGPNAHTVIDCAGFKAKFKEAGF